MGEHVRLSGLVLVPPEVRVGNSLPLGVLDAERLLKFADGPRRREKAGRHRSHTRGIAGAPRFFTLTHVRTRPER